MVNMSIRAEIQEVSWDGVRPWGKRIVHCLGLVRGCGCRCGEGWH